TINSEILTAVVNLHRTLAGCVEVEDYDTVSNEIATIVAMDYILAKRLGIGYGSIDNKINDLLTIAIDNNHELELEFSDMSELKKYICKR
ncbi:MAG: MazG-like family protein, partial [Firmicutes bacterium]|nr:MazG-like family protein [Bacillota bacterium]